MKLPLDLGIWLEPYLGVFSSPLDYDSLLLVVTLTVSKYSMLLPGGDGVVSKYLVEFRVRFEALALR
jgi:hypothetical protein